jgi:hypothetical protein
MVMFEERLYLLGGKRSDRVFHADAWYRGEANVRRVDKK